jgi:hypothetical protein
MALEKLGSESGNPEEIQSEEPVSLKTQCEYLTNIG